MQRSQKFSSSSDSSASPTPPGGHSPQNTVHRPESKTELKPLFTQTPLSFSEREKKPSPPPRKRRKQEPKTPALTFNPLERMIPNGRQDPLVQTPVLHQGQPTPISATNEFYEGLPNEIDDHLASGNITTSHSTASKRPRAPSGGDEPPQPPSCPVPYSNFGFRDHYESPSSGGSSSSPTTSYGSSSHPQYALDTESSLYQQELMQYCDPNGTDYPPQRRVTPDVYVAPRDPGYPPPQGGTWQYCPYPNPNGYRDSF
ncbi:hypothetical protein M405DRAFT_135906 [Rhizopogon salebrosus TDB-379]|nr:hypothetical protein M405DRAFT_135906 [Rhizopogon salebrosus TDB-379]